MKKNGFTLAEVLITLAIIGVIATLTLPALMNNTQEQQYVTGLKKGINTLTEVAQLNSAIDGYDYSAITEDSDDEDDKQSLSALFYNRASVDRELSGSGDTVGRGAAAAGESNYVIYFRDGSAISFPKAAQHDVEAANTMRSDGLPHGIGAIYDTNGDKAPNVLSNCQGLVTGATDDAGNVSTCTKRMKVIKDQFAVRLRGGIAVPNGAAANWAFNK